LLGQKAPDLRRRTGRQFDQTLVADPESWSSDCFGGAAGNHSVSSSNVGGNEVSVNDSHKPSEGALSE
jgi:hypothetical protein